MQSAPGTSAVHKRTVENDNVEASSSNDSAKRRLVEITSAEEMEAQEIPGTFITPKRTAKISTLIRPPSPPLGNRFEPLDSITVTEMSNQTAAPVSRPRPRQTKPKTAPPIIIQGRTQNHQELVTEIKKTVKKGFNLKYAARSIIMYINDLQEYKLYKQKLAENDVKFHTYTAKEEKNHAFVLRGLHEQVTEDDVKDELLKNYKIDVKRVYKMRTTRTPLYLVVTADNITLKQLQSTVRSLMYTKIEWERRTNERLITQCRRCQVWGHATSNCFRDPRCVKCAGLHWSRNCSRPRDEPPECANCGGPHTAANICCPIYTEKRAALEQESNGQRYVEAPIPATNVWQERSTIRNTTANQPSQPRSQQQAEVMPASPPLRSPPRRPTPSAGQDEFNELLKEMERLNSLINLKDTIKAVRLLNDMLEKANGPMDTISVLQDFTANHLHKFNILPSRS